MNQYDHLFSDIPHNLRVQGKTRRRSRPAQRRAAAGIRHVPPVQRCTRKKLTGSRGAFDPIEMVNDFVGRLTGYAAEHL